MKTQRRSYSALSGWLALATLGACAEIDEEQSEDDIESIQSAINEGQWESLGGNITSAPGISSWGVNRLDMFARGLEGNVFHKAWNGTAYGGWENLGGNIVDAPRAASWAKNRVDVVARGPTNAVYKRYWNGSSWSSTWENIGGQITNAPAISSWGTNRLDFFGRGPDGHVWHKSWNGTAYSGWEDLGGNIVGSPAAVSWGPNRIDVFVRGTDNGLYHRYWGGSVWSNGWEALGGTLASSPTVAASAVNRLDIFAANTNKQVIHKHWSGTSFSDWQSIGGTIVGEPAAVSCGPGRVDVVARGTDNALWHTYLLTACSIDSSAIPANLSAARTFATNLKGSCGKDYAAVISRLVGTRYTPSKDLTIRFVDKPFGGDYPGATVGAEIQVNYNYVQQNPGDRGMILHEMTHVIEAYPNGGDPWAEGIADWVRYQLGEPPPGHQGPNANCLGGDHYSEGYECAAALLDYVGRTYSTPIAPRVNELLHAGNTGAVNDAFRTATGKTVPQLWTDCRATTCNGGRAQP